jgi:hypothetical protein
MERSTFQRIALFGGPIGYIALGLVHPMSDPKVGDPTGFFVFLHVVQPFLIGLMAYALWTLVEGLPGRAAKVARFAVIPYAIAYTMFDSIIGVAKGVFYGEAGSLSAADQAVVSSVLETDHWLGYAIYLAAGLSWLVAVVAVAVAVQQVAPLRVSLLIGIGGLIFALGHPIPPGPIGMTLFLVGVALLELRYRAARPSAHVEALPALQL